MFLKFVIVCCVFLDIPSPIYSGDAPMPPVKKQLEIITSKIHEHIESILQPLDVLDDSRRAELKEFSHVISDTYNEMAIKLQVQIENFLEHYGPPPTAEIKFGTMFNDPAVDSAHKEGKSGVHPRNPYMEEGDVPLRVLEHRSKDTPSPEDEEMYLPNDHSVPTLSPLSSEEVDNNIITYKSATGNDHFKSHKTPHLPIYYNGGKQQQYSKILASYQAQKLRSSTTPKSWRRITSSEEERMKEEEARILEKIDENHLKAAKNRKPKTSSEEDRNRDDKYINDRDDRDNREDRDDKVDRDDIDYRDNRDERDNRDNRDDRDDKHLGVNRKGRMTSSEEQDRKMIRKALMNRPPQRDSSGEALLKKMGQVGMNKRNIRKFIRNVDAQKFKFSFPPAPAPVRTKFPAIYPSTDRYVEYPEDSAKEEQD